MSNTTASQQSYQMPRFGTGMIPSIVAVTAFQAVDQAESLTNLYLEQIKEAETTQQAQGALTKNLADSAEATIHEQANATEDNAWATCISGSIGLGSPVAATGYETLLRRSGASSLAEQTTNLANAKNLLEGGGQVPIAGAAHPGVREFTTDDLKSLAKSNINFRELQDPETQGKLQQLGQWKAASKSPNQPDPLPPEESAARAQIHKNLSAKLKQQTKEAEQASNSYQATTDRWSHRLETVGGGLQQAVSSKWNLNAANDQKNQATNQAAQTYAQFANDSAQQNVQTQKQVSSSIMDDERSVLQNTIGGLATASSRA